MHLIDIFIQMEDDLQLYSKHFDEFYYWLYIREELYNDINSQLNNSPKGFSKTHIVFSKIPKLFITSVVNNKYRVLSKKGPFDVVIACHPRRTLVDGNYQSIYTDTFQEELDKAITIEYPNEGNHYTPCYTKNICYLDRMYYVRAFYQKFAPVSIGDINANDVKFVLESVKQYIYSHINYSINTEQLFNKILLFYKRYLYTKKYLKKLLTKWNPKLIIEVVHYRFENLVLNEVAKECGIKIVELQHGLTGHYHIAYNYGHIDVNRCLPDFFFAFSDYWISEMRLPSNIVESKAIGFPYYEKKTQLYKKEKTANYILFLSSGTVGTKLSELAIKLNQLIQDTGFEIVYKLHPGEFSEWREWYPELEESGIKVIDNASEDLYSLFAKSVAQVGVYSTALFEGLGYSLKTYILDAGHTEHIKCLLEMNYAVLVQNEKDIINDLMNKSCQDEIVNADYFWKRNSHQNMIDSIDSIVNK